MYQKLTSIENLFTAWQEFRKGKGNKRDVHIFERRLEDNLFFLHNQLVSKSYRHGSYASFFVQDPKVRHIHKAEVPDRIVHHLLYKFLYATFDPGFIFDSYSCRLDKGTHIGVRRLESFTRKVSRNYTRDCWALKCDIKKFFASIDHQILVQLLAKKITDPNILWLLRGIIDSFHSEFGGNKGVPLGNLTSQIFANIYLNEFDQFVKSNLKIKYYLRYADDFIILSPDKKYLQKLVTAISEFLQANLKLELHPKKIVLRNLSWGVDFLGYIILPHYILPRTKTKRRLFKKLEMKHQVLESGKITQQSFSQTFQSYLGFLSHASSFKLQQKLKSDFGV